MFYFARVKPYPEVGLIFRKEFNFLIRLRMRYGYSYFKEELVNIHDTGNASKVALFPPRRPVLPYSCIQCDKQAFGTKS